jgi:hypothetical protein
MREQDFAHVRTDASGVAMFHRIGPVPNRRMRGQE